MIEVQPVQDFELDLWRGIPDQQWSRRQWSVAAASVALHLLLFTSAMRLHSLAPQVPPDRQIIQRHTVLYLPPDLLTQRAPNKKALSRNIDLADLLPSPASSARRAVPRPVQKRFEMPPTSPKVAAHTPAQILPEAPNIPPQQTASLPPGTLGPLVPPAPPPPRPVESPFQNVGSESAPANPTLKPPKADVESAVKGLAQNNSGHHVVVSDDAAAPPSPGSPNGLGVDGGPHAAVELKSDPQGADFRAYLTRILAIVRANWRRVIPESARMGTLRGRTVVEFIINRDGGIPKLVIADSSGSDPLDRAAGAGLSMSNPLPPLPADFRGFQVRLAFTFSYNMPSQ